MIAAPSAPVNPVLLSRPYRAGTPKPTVLIDLYIVNIPADVILKFAALILSASTEFPPALTGNNSEYVFPEAAPKRISNALPADVATKSLVAKRTLEVCPDCD